MLLTDFIRRLKLHRYVSGVVYSSGANSAYYDLKKSVFCPSYAVWGSCGFISGGCYSYVKFFAIHEESTLRWKSNWDLLSRAESSSVIQKQGVRHILLVRHGQYKNVFCKDDHLQGLTALGEEQAHLLGRHLSQVVKGEKVRGIFHSNMKRARETAHILSSYLKDVECISDPLLAEGIPALPDPPSPNFHPTDVEVKLGSARIESAFKKYFYRPGLRYSGTDDKSENKEEAKEGGEGEVYDILVCHGKMLKLLDSTGRNVIRYFFCRALQLPSFIWLRFSIYNCGVTWLTIDSTGHVSAREMGNVGFIPFSQVTYT